MTFVYCSSTTTRRNLDAILECGFGLMLAPSSYSWATYGARYVLDNGAWGAYCAGQAWSPDGFLRLLDGAGRGADWAVLPDVVAGGRESLEVSLEWIPKLRGACPRWLLALQDGMDEADVARIPAHVGLFLGGSTAWKVANIERFAAVAREQGRYYHVGRVNTRRRFVACQGAGADSVDGSSVSRFAVNAERVAAWAAQAILPFRKPA